MTTIEALYQAMEKCEQELRETKDLKDKEVYSDSIVLETELVLEMQRLTIKQYMNMTHNAIAELRAGYEHE